MPDPQSESTFLNSKLDWGTRQSESNLKILNFYEELISIRRELPALSFLSKEHMEVFGFDSENVLYFRRWHNNNEVFALFNFAEEAATILPPIPRGSWQKRLDSAMGEWGGPGTILPDKLDTRSANPVTINPCSMALYEKIT